MKQFPEASLGKGEQEAQRLAQGHSERQWQRESCQSSPEPRSREQQVELSRLLASPDEGRMSGPQGGSEGASAGSERSAEHVQEVPGAERQEVAVHSGDSDRTEEDAEIPEDPLLSFPAELSALERLGLHRAALTEQDVEAAFAHLALAFSCDMFTLRQRVEVEKRARDAAEENIQEELGQCRAALERLGLSCMAADSKETLEQLQCNLAVLAAAIERATSAAEKLGAVHQEARMSRAAEVMVQHVENLKRHHVREHAELEEMKRLIQQNSRNRQLVETQDDAEPRLRLHPLMRNFQQVSARRRVSIAVIPKQLLPGTSLDGRAELAREGALHQPSTQRRELELRRRSIVMGEPVAELDSGGPGLESEEPEEPELTSKVSLKELWWPWLFLPQHYGILIWLLLLGLVFFFLVPVLELQKLQPAASPKA
nr:PREDICTED: lymphoid-restricted membrane protein-like isoform X1 [Apteryx mantelli mantelli]